MTSGYATSSSSSTVIQRHVVSALILLVTIVYASLLVFFPRLFARWPFSMHFYYNDKAVLANGFSALMPLALSLFFLALVVSRLWGRSWMFVAGLFACAVALQLSWSLLEGRAAERISSTLLSKHYGHSEFVELAHDDARLLDVAREYETIVATDPRFVYTRSKPPGQLLFYMLSVRLFRALGLEAVSRCAVEPLGFFTNSPYAAFGPFATLLFVTLSCSPVFVLSRLGSVLDVPAMGAHLSLAFVLMPAVNLITMHMDQILYPVLVSCTLYTVALALHRHAGYALPAAVLTYVSIYVSFSLLILLPTIGLLLIGYGALGSPSRGTVVRVGLIFAAGMLASAGLFYLLLNFQPLASYIRAVAHHRAWMGVDGIVGLRGTIHNFYEFSVWVGIPVVILYVANCYRVVVASRAHLEPLTVFVLGYPFLLLCVSVFGGSEHEIGRLWMPLAVPALLPVARELRSLHGDRRPWLYVIASAVMILAMKNYQDFQ
jgi:hypothetical protein